MTTLKLTIDSTEKLEDTLRVVGALYNVTLEVSAGHAAATTPTSNTGKPVPAANSRPRRKARTAQKPKRSQAGRPATNGNRQVDTATVRAWARENGYEVAERGRVPGTVLTAFQQANNA